MIMSLEALVNQNYKHFSESDRAVWKYLSEHRKECEDIAIKKMGRKMSASPTPSVHAALLKDSASRALRS